MSEESLITSSYYTILHDSSQGLRILTKLHTEYMYEIKMKCSLYESDISTVYETKTKMHTIQKQSRNAHLPETNMKIQINTIQSQHEIYAIQNP